MNAAFRTVIEAICENVFIPNQLIAPTRIAYELATQFNLPTREIHVTDPRFPHAGAPWKSMIEIIQHVWIHAKCQLDVQPLGPGRSTIFP